MLADERECIGILTALKAGELPQGSGAYSNALLQLLFPLAIPS